MNTRLWSWTSPNTLTSSLKHNSSSGLLEHVCLPQDWVKPQATSPQMTRINRSPTSPIKSVTLDERAWVFVRNYVTSWLVIKRLGKIEKDEEEERSRQGPMPRRRQNKTPRADLMNGERLWQQSSRKFSFVLKEENSLKVGLPLWTWYYKKDKGGLTLPK